MKIKDAIKITKGLSLICTNKEKDYKFLSSIEYADIVSSDYIYIPLIEDNRDVFKEIEKHLKNPYCKGFYLKKELLKTPDKQVFYHNIMKKYSSKIEVVVLVRNPFNSGVEIGEENIKTFHPEVITVAGTEEKAVVLNLMSYVLGSKAKTVCSIKNAGPWQKLTEPMLLCDDKTKYCIIELMADKTDIYQYAKRMLRNNTLIFTKTSLNFLNRYNNKEKFIDEMVSCADNSEYIKNIFTFEENDLINSSIKTNNINIVEECEINTDITKPSLFKKKCLKVNYKDITFLTNNFSYYIPRCFVISYFALKSFGISEGYIKKKFLTFRDTSGIYEETKLDFNNYLVTSTNDHTAYSIKNAIRQFSFEYSGFKKVIILSKIENLGQYSNNIHKELMEELAKEKFNTVVLINMNEFEADYKVCDKNAFVKRFKFNNNINHENFIANLRIFLEGQINNNTALLVCVPSYMNLNPLFTSGEMNKCATT